MCKKTRNHIAIRLNPEKDADILNWYESLPHYERSAYVKDALNQYIGGILKSAPFYHRAKSYVDNNSSADKSDTHYSIKVADESSADEVQSNIDAWKDLV